MVVFTGLFIVDTSTKAMIATPCFVERSAHWRVVLFKIVSFGNFAVLFGLFVILFIIVFVIRVILVIILFVLSVVWLIILFVFSVCAILVVIFVVASVAIFMVILFIIIKI